VRFEDVQYVFLDEDGAWCFVQAEGMVWPPETTKAIMLRKEDHELPAKSGDEGELS
jgi:hypothetical protein